MRPAQEAQLIAVLGSGGVGKTTVAASIAFALAEQGFKSVVITVDPAHRLAQALGLETLSNEPKLVKEFSNGGSLHALWLDQSTGLEDLIRRHGKGISNIDKVVENRLFKIIQSQLGGIEEYLGVEKILSLRDSGRFEICVLDTPPSRHALDFLEAPRHLLRFFDEGVLKVFLGQDSSNEKTGLFSRVFNSGKNQVIDVFKAFLGQSFLAELAALLSAIKPVHKVFTDTASAIEAWTRSENCEFALVSLLEPYPLDEARLLTIELDAKNLKAPSMIVLNKALPSDEPPQALLDVFGSLGFEAMKAAHTMQESLREKLSGDKTFGEAVLTEIPRASVRQLNQQQLLGMGERILSAWQSKNTKIFSKT